MGWCESGSDLFSSRIATPLYAGNAHSLAGLAAIGIEYLAGELTRRRNFADWIGVDHSLAHESDCCNVWFIWVISQDSRLYLSKDEIRANVMDCRKYPR